MKPMNKSYELCKWHFDIQTGEDQGPGDRTTFGLANVFMPDAIAILVWASS